MPKHHDDDSPCYVQKRLQPFLDCIAHLLAKRWLREQRQQEEEPLEPRPEPSGEEAEQ